MRQAPDVTNRISFRGRLYEFDISFYGKRKMYKVIVKTSPLGIRATLIRKWFLFWITLGGSEGIEYYVLKTVDSWLKTYNIPSENIIDKRIRKKE